VFDLSKVGQDANAQYRAARDAAQKDVNEEEAKIGADIRALEEKRATLAADTYKEQQTVLVQQLQDLRSKAAKKSLALEEVRQDVVKRIAAMAQPYVASAYQANHCALLLSRDAVLAGNPSMDITAEVVKGLDGKIATMRFERRKDDKSGT
jgi:Skp family chaperone for outer membrane proteins